MNTKKRGMVHNVHNVQVVQTLKREVLAVLDGNRSRRRRPSQKGVLRNLLR